MASNLIRAALLAIAMGGAMRACAAEGGAVGESRAVYARELSGLQSNAVTTAKQAQATYAESLARMEQDARAAGELEAVKALVQERARFADQGRLTSQQLAATPANLRALQERFVQYTTDQELKSNQAIVRLTEQYLARLDTLKRDLTRQGDLVAAQAAADEAAATEQSPAFQAASFAVAEWRAASEAAPAPVAAPAPHGAASGVVPGDDLVTSKDVTIYPQGQLPPSASVSYRDLALKVADGAAALSVRARAHETRDSEGSDRSKRFRLISREERSTSLALQLTLQRKSGAQGPAVLVVEHFGTPAAGGAKRPLTAHVARLADLGERVQYVDFPEVTATSSKTEVNWRAGDAEAWAAGAQLAGWVASVYDAQGALIWRGTTDETLLPLARGLKATESPPDAAPAEGAFAPVDPGVPPAVLSEDPMVRRKRAEELRRRANQPPPRKGGR